MPKPEEQNRTPECRGVTKLLPVYLNRSLEEQTTRRVEAHLAACAACRQEERDTRTALALFEGHLPVEMLLDYALAQPMPTRRRAVVESHLAVCGRCSEEVATVGQTASGQHTSGATIPNQRAADAAAVELPLPEPRPADRAQISPASRRQDGRRLRTLAWAACLATVVAAAGWIWTWRQLVDERAAGSSPAARANLSVVELLPATGSLLRRGDTDPGATTNRVELPDDAGELVLVLLSGGRSCESGCSLEIYRAGEAQPTWRVEGLVASPNGHLTLALPGEWLTPDRTILAVRDPASGEPATEYLVEIQRQSPTSSKPAQ